MRTHEEKTFYTEQEFSETEFNAIERAREHAILNKYGNFSLLGTGSQKMSHVYKVTAKSGSGSEEAFALKIISGITRDCSSSDLEISKNQLKIKLRGSEFENSAESEIKLQYDGINRCPNVIPLDGTDLLDWICPDFSRIGVDYVLKMPLADCLLDTMKDFQTAENYMDEIIQLGVDICIALESLHTQGIYHRDIKPANIYRYHKNYCLGDFGIAIHKTNLKLFEIGTEAYCAPEQHYKARERNPWLCRKYNHRVDIYSLGLVLYELAGKKSVCNFFDQRINGALPELSIESEGLKRIIHTACQFDPDERYQSATVFKENLERLQQDKNYIPSQEIDIVSNQVVTNSSCQQPNGDTYIGKEKDPYDDEFEPREDEEQVVTSIANTMWNVGLFWYEKSQEPASRFANLTIEKNIMPLISISHDAYNFPVKCYTKDSTKDRPLSQIIANINNIGDMYLIGEGGSGKTTALYSIMQDTYKGQMYPIKYTNKITIPLFVELSKAPDICGKTYQEGHSTFIRRYLYLLIKSAQQKKGMLTEDKNVLREVFGNSNRCEQDDILETVNHLLKEDNGIQYLLLLDGLNEVSRKEISFEEGSTTVVELIIDEIRELQEYSNVTVIITSRADEAVNFGNDLPKYYLSGIDDTTIKQYLENNNISCHDIMQNSRLLATLRVPFFLKLYCSLIFKSGISTPGEILYNFFKERTSMYSLRARINAIHSEQNAIGSIHVYKRITEKMQWFILDFILPEIGWYMEKNSLYTIDQPTIKTIVDRVLTGTEDTDICGKYGMAIFEDYHKGSDGSVNTKNYAEELMKLTSTHQTYMQAIIEYCVYSLGILYVNNQSYGFIHQHLRDFFAALKNINTLKMACDVYTIDAKAGYNCLSQFNNDMIHSNVSGFIGEILSEYKGKSVHKYSLLENCIDLYRRKYTPSDNVKYGLYNLLKIIYEARKSLSSLDLSYLDLTNCHFNGINLENSILDHSIIEHDNLFPFGHTEPVVKAIFSNTGKYIYSASYDGTVKLWHASNLKYVKTVVKLENTIIRNIVLSNNNDFLLVSTPKYSILYETQTYTKLHEYKDAFTGIFNKDDSYLALAYYSDPIQLINLKSFEAVSKLGYLFKGSLNGNRRKNIMLFSPNSKYFVFVNTEMNIEVWNMESLQLMGHYEMSESIASFDFDSKGKRIGVAYYAAEKKSFEIIEFCNILQNLKSKERKSFKEHLSDIFQQKYSYSSMISFRLAPDIPAVKFVSNDRYFLTADSDGCLQLYDLLNNNAKYTLQGDCAHDVGYISEYKALYDDFLVTGGLDGTIKIWNLKTLQCTGIIPNGSSGLIREAKFSPDGKLIVIAANDVTIWYVKQGTFENVLADKGVVATSIAFSPSGKFFAVGFENGLLILYKYENGKFSSVFEGKVFDGMITNLQFEKNETFVLISETKTVIKMLNIRSKELIEINCNADIAWHSVFCSKDNSILYCDCLSVEKLSFDGQSYTTSKTDSYRQLNKTDRHMSMYAAEYIACSPDCKYVAFGWHGGQIEIRPLEDLNSCITVMYTGTYQVRGIVFSADSKYMAIISRRNGMKIYETQHWNCIRSVYGYQKPQSSKNSSNTQDNEPPEYVTCIDCYNDNETFLAASSNGTVKLWKPFLKEHQTSKAIKDSRRRNIYKKMLVTGYKFIKRKTIPINILAGFSLDVNSDFLDIYKYEYPLHYVYGLRLKNTSIKNLHPSSDLSKNDYKLLEIYGAKILEDI